MRHCISKANVVTPERRRQIMPILLGFGFGIILIILVLNGGMCERYQRKMERQEMMRHYIDSVRSEEQRQKLNR